jgi:hypothetical protein
MNTIDEGLRVVTVPDRIIVSVPLKPYDGIITIVMATDGAVLHDHAWRITLRRAAHTMTLTTQDRHHLHLPLVTTMIPTLQEGHTGAREARREVITERTIDAHTGNM